MTAHDSSAASPIGEPLSIALPAWVGDVIDVGRPYVDDRDRVALAIRLAHENVEYATGGPFGAAIFEEQSGRLVSVGVNLVALRSNAVLHAEIMAFMFAQRAAGSFTLASPPLARAHVLATSCAPCAMCLGAIHWSGVARVLVGATREDAMAVGFDEGPVFPESIAYLERNGVTFVDGIERNAARAVLERYVALGRPVYNA